MMLRALTELAERERLGTDAAFERRPVSFILAIDARGCLVGKPVATGEDDRPKRFEIPRGYVEEEGGGLAPVRSVQVAAGFLVDKALYALGMPDAKKAGAPAAERARRCLATFRSLVETAESATKEPALAAVIAFLDNPLERQKAVNAIADAPSNALLAFQFGDEFVHDSSNVRAWWRSRHATSAAGATRSTCLVTGKAGVVADLHEKIKGVPGAVTAGAPLISFNIGIFESYGLSGSENAPISQGAATAYVAALNRLLSPTPQNGDGEALPTRRVRLTESSTVVYWSRLSSAFVDVIAGLLAPDAETVGRAFQSAWGGREIPIEDAGEFYALVLSGCQGRIAVKSWLVSTVRDVAANLRRYFREIDVRRRQDEPLVLYSLLRSIAPRGEVDRLAPNRAQELFEAAVFGRSLPISILDAAIRRCRVAEQDSQRVPDARAAIVRLCLSRIPKEMKAMENRSTGEVLGRMMAHIESLQYKALGDVGSTVVDQFFGSACVAPESVFPKILKLSHHHYRKAFQNEALRGAAKAIQKRIDELCAELSVARAKDGRANGFPRFLPLPEQGRFVLGYHAQRHENLDQAIKAKELRDSRDTEKEN